MGSQHIINPLPGMLATVRNRRAIVSSVDPFDSHEGRLHLVFLEYIDADGTPSDTLIWEREPNATLLEPTALPRVATEAPMPAPDFDALQCATRWTALSPFIDHSDVGVVPRTTIASPFFGAVQTEDFQLVPLLKALQMPRISLLLADDVGLGKTIEAGLILTELLLRRRIRRVLIMSPASLRSQWQLEMRDKFALTFDIVDRAETHALQKRMGLDANPWRTFPRIITSYYYLRQPDILEQFLAACRQPTGSAQLPWDLLIVDEAHNLMPSNFGEDSDLAKMLRHVSPWFEHKLFLTATPHNGHTRCFSGLLEQLDPVRFTQTSEFSVATKRRIEEVVIRRLKREINALDRAASRPERFSERIPEPLPLYFGPKERLLSRAFQAFRAAVRRLMTGSGRSEQLAGAFAVEVLNKRLLSSPYSFADSWYRLKEGLALQEGAEIGELNAARRAVEEDLDDDQEAEGRIQHIARTTGAWLKPLAPRLAQEIEAIDKALEFVGLLPPVTNADPPFPNEDARWDRLCQLIEDRLRDGTHWLSDERLIVFTEYKTTLDYVERRLKAAFPADGVILVLYGGMPESGSKRGAARGTLDHRPKRDDITRAFNDPADPVRILVATDAASEGLNLQETARFVLHYDIPFNPARLDQRNGRLDRHGQARDVVVFHFTSEDDADIRFLAHVVGKIHTIREELGSMGDVFDAAFERRFIYLEESDNVLADLDRAIEKSKGRTDIPRSADVVAEAADSQALEWLVAEVDLTPQRLRDTLEHALGIDMGLPRLEAPDERGRVRLQMPLPPRWEGLIDESLRLPDGNDNRGPLPNLVFDSHYFVETRNGRPVFRPSKDTVLLHLGHPMFQQALARYARARFPGDGLTASRWAVRFGQVPPGADALLLLTVEEIAVNELRETFHHWIRTVRLPIFNNGLGPLLPHMPASHDRPAAYQLQQDHVEMAQMLWEEVELDVRAFVKQQASELTSRAIQQLRIAGEAALRDEGLRFRSRREEVQRAMQETTLARLEAEITKLVAEQQELKLMPALFEDIEAARTQRIQDIDHRMADIEEELNRRRNHYQELLDRLKVEQERVIKELLPKRYALRGAVQVFPVTVEIRLPEAVR